MNQIDVNKLNQMTYTETVEKLIDLNTHARDFWSNALGWAPIEAANLLTKSRLDWQVSLSYSMKNWDNNFPIESEEGNLILAWTNLGTLVEGTMKLFLSVYLKDYLEDPDNYKKGNGKITDPDTISLGNLREYFKANIWGKQKPSSEFNDWVLLIQQRRNAIHAFRNRDIGTVAEFKSHTKKYLAFLMFHLDRLPYPDNQYGPDLHL